MTYDTTLDDTLSTTPVREVAEPACLRRDRLSPDYLPTCTRSQLALVVTLCLIFAWTSLNRLNHTDLWGHINFGRWMAQHHSLPAIDPFAAAPSDVTVTHTAWLSQLLGYETLATFGLEGLVLAHATLATLAVGLMVLAIRQRGVPLCWAIAGGVAYYLLALPIVGTIRPQLFGMVGAPLVLLACAQLPEKRGPLVWLPLLFLLWANLHGSFFMGIVMLGACCIGTTWRIFGETGNLKQTAVDLRCVRVWAALLLSLLAASVNPLGPGIYINVLTFGNHAALADISEWRSLALVSFSGVLFYTSLIGLFVTLKLSSKRWEMTDLLLVLVFGLTTLSAMRMLQWWAAVWPWVIVPYAISVWEARFGRTADTAPPTTMRTVLAMGFVFMTLLIAPPSNNFVLGRERGLGQVAGKETPIYVGDEIARRKLQGAFLAPMDWADYFVWAQPDNFRPLVYSHVHLLEPATWNDYQQLSAGSADWLAIADRHELKYLVLSRARQRQLIGAVLKQPARARVLYQDQKSLLVELLPPPAVAQR